MASVEVKRASPKLAQLSVMSLRPLEPLKGVPKSQGTLDRDAQSRMLDSERAFDREGEVADVEELILKTPDEEVLCVRFGAELTGRHLSCLMPEAWLNDEVVNAYLRILSEENKGQIWCPNSFFWPKLRDNGYSAVQRWTKRASIELASLRVVLVPLHLTSHWALGVIDLVQHELLYLDSLGLAPPELLESRLTEFLEREVDLAIAPWTLRVEDAPRQRNTSDCGLFMLLYAECFAASRPLEFATSAKAIRRKRQEIALAILKGKLGSVSA
mmetsp:Transcript_4925/g.8777  ORF Transcript_4925/g.8777 Transcript_4925/m.8777 type:complete len:271 (+) Transcript_4925:59-871(+)